MSNKTREASLRDILNAVQQDHMSVDDAMKFFHPIPGATPGADGAGQIALTLKEPRRTGYISSAGDERTVNNLMRHKYRVLSEAEKEQMQRIKDLGMAFVLLLHNVGGTLSADPDAVHDGEAVLPERQASRELSVAQTKVEEAVMWAVKHVTR